MAKYADYVKNQDNIDSELKDAQNQQNKRNIPDSVVKRFDGKSLEDVLESYSELQSLNSRQGEDLGKLRKTVDQLLELQSQPVQHSPQVTDDPDVGITSDDLYSDPDTAIGKVVEKKSKATAERLERLEQALTQREIAVNKQGLETKYNGWEQEIATPEFQNWVQGSSARARLFNAANQYDFAAANDLLELWYDKKGSRQQVQDTAERERQFRDATLESSSPSGVDVVDTYSRSDLMEKRIAAKSGNRQAERWLQAHGNAITTAYREGRLTD
jgi:hypothetical protein